MRFIAYNGSPRGNLGITKPLIEAFGAGVASEGARVHAFSTFTLQQGGRDDALREAFLSADAVLVAFPIVSGTMPASVKRLFEALGELEPGTKRPTLLFLVHSAFPNSGQFGPMERYVTKIADRLGCALGGVMCRPNMTETLEGAPTIDRETERLVREAGAQWRKGGQLSATLLASLAGKRHAGALGRVKHFVLAEFPLRNLTWARELLRHGSFSTRKARPDDQERR